MKPVLEIKNLKFGQGQPKICVPVVGRNLSEILDQAEALIPLNPDLCEWRIDWFAGAGDPQLLLAAARAIREALPHLPLLFTCRTKEEGGRLAISKEDYLRLCRQMIASGCCDLIDLELFTAADQLPALIELAHAAGVFVVASSHDFEKTPSEQQLLSRMKRMAQLGADLPKIAVMPQKPEDVLTLLSATLKMKQAGQPVITMSMGTMGALSRACGELFGSCMTFGAAEHASAPGQISVPELRRIMDALCPTPREE